MSSIAGRSARSLTGRVLSELARSFGRIASDYDVARPEYATEAVDRAAEVLELGTDARIVDLAAGSGTLTRALSERFRNVVAVEPDEEMRAVLAQRPTNLEVRVGTAERIPLPDASVDAVFVGDAFHWFDGPVAVAEIDRVLRPGRGVALLWNLWWNDGDDGTSDSLEPPLPPLARALFDDVYVRSGRAAARAEKAEPAACFRDSPFGPLAIETFERSRQLSGAEVVELYSTVSAVAWLPVAERAELKRQLVSLLGDAYLLKITTVLYWGRRG
jgi:ubiquinone/menaquinone biosynthesis C-methylase UbiE